MKRNAEVSLIIATYNWPEALKVCLESVCRQTLLPAEVIVADDGSDERTSATIALVAQHAPFPIVHEWHEDRGFRKTTILNKAIAKATLPYIIQIDGDIVLSPHFIADHLRMAERGCFIRGTRVLLDAQSTANMLNTGKLPHQQKLLLRLRQPCNALRLPYLIARFFARREASGRRVKGCNMAFWKQDLLAVNGYDNTLTGWGHEDEELSWRLVHTGVQKKIVKLSAVAYHLFHTQLSRQEEPHHAAFLQHIKEQKISKTPNGIDSL